VSIVPGCGKLWKSRAARPRLSPNAVRGEILRLRDPTVRFHGTERQRGRVTPLRMTVRKLVAGGGGVRHKPPLHECLKRPSGTGDDLSYIKTGSTDRAGWAVGVRERKAQTECLCHGNMEQQTPGCRQTNASTTDASGCMPDCAADGGGATWLGAMRRKGRRVRASRYRASGRPGR
jgi:hypothetical protein